MACRTWNNLEIRKTLVLGRTLAALFIGWILLALPQRVLSQGAPPDEYQVKLAFLYNFTKFVEWPDQAFPSQQAPLVICVVGTDPFGMELKDELRARKTAGHPIAVTRLAASGDFSTCHIAFIRAEERKQFARILAGLKGRDILTVGETDGFLESGGHFNFIFLGNSLHFYVNLTATRETRLKISARLLALAMNLASPRGANGTELEPSRSHSGSR
jgi:uncharacterized protein DUF4154